MKKSFLFRKISLLLVALLLLSFLASCANGDKPESTTANNNTAGADESTAPEGPQFPKADYDGQDFVIYSRNQDAAHYQAFFIVPFEDSADVIDEQAVTRNIRTEEYYHIKLKTIEVEDPTKTLKADLAAGVIGYQAMLAMRCDMGSLALTGAYVNLHKLNCDLTTSWWDKNAAEQYDVAGKLYLMPNDVSVCNIAGTRFFFFSKGILEDFNLKSPYDYVKENNWTLDSFLTLVKGVSNPGSGEDYGNYGLMNEEGAVAFHMLTGCGVPRVEKDADGQIICNIGTEYAERTQSMLERFKAVAEDKNCVLSVSDAVGKDRRPGMTDDTFNHARILFTEDKFLFIQTDMEVAKREFSDMPRGFGVVPNPKFDTNQEEYYHQMDNNTLIWGIPNDPGIDLDMVSNVFDYWAYTSTSTVMETFYEVTIKAKRASDPIACEMLDTVKGSIRYYPTDLYTVSDIGSMLNAAYNKAVASAWKSYNTPISRQLTRIYDKIEALDD